MAPGTNLAIVVFRHHTIFIYSTLYMYVLQLFIYQFVMLVVWGCYNR